MVAKKLLGWLIVIIVLLFVSAVILAGALINSNITSSHKAEPMKEKKEVKETSCAIGQDIFINIDGKRSNVGRFEMNEKNIKVINDGVVDNLEVAFSALMPPQTDNVWVRISISTIGKPARYGSRPAEGDFSRVGVVPNLFRECWSQVFVHYIDQAREKWAWTLSDEGYSVRGNEVEIVENKDGRWVRKNKSR